MDDAERFDGVSGEEERASGFRRRMFVRRRYHAPVTAALIVLCAVMALAERLQPQVGVEFMFYPPLAQAQPYRFITSAFLHNGFWHLVLNMYALWLLGRALEPALGWARYLALYFLSAIAGNAAVYAVANLTGGWNVGAVGASGAIFGLFGALMIMYRKVNANMSGILVILAINLVYGFVMPGISWESHVGGLLVGAFLMWLWLSIREGGQGRRTRAFLDIASGLAVLALTGFILWI